MPRVIPGPPATEKSSKSIALAPRHGQLYLAYITKTSAFIFRNCTEVLQVIEQPFDDNPLECIAFDRRTGQIALSSGQDFVIYDEVYTFVPEEQNRTNGQTGVHTDGLNITWTYGRRSSVSGTPIRSLSWGLGGEILVSNNHLSLFHLSTQTQDLRNTWSYPLAAEVEAAIFSPDASLIASYGRHDRLVKVWRRLSDRVSSTGAKTSDFDFIYLPHPRMVDDVKWRQPLHEDLLVDNIVYTTSVDQELRAWTSDIPHDSHLLTLHETLSLECDYDCSRKVAVVLDDDVFAWALTKATKRGPAGDEQAEAETLLKRISKGQFEVVLTLSIDGSMDAFTLHNLGSRNDKESTQELFFTSSGIPLLRDYRGSLDDIWISAEVQRHGDHDLLLFVGCPDHIVVYEAQLFGLFSIEPVVNKLLVLDGHRAHIDALLASPEKKIKSRDVDEKTITWKLENNIYMKAILSENELKDTNVSSNHATMVPPEIQAAVTEDIQLVSCTDEWTAVVTSAVAGRVQIWRNGLSTTFSGAPESVFFASETVVSMCWTTDHIHPVKLVVCTNYSVYVLSASCLINEADQRWIMSWSYHTRTLMAQVISHVVYDTGNIIVSVASQLYTFAEEEWYCHNKSLTYNEELPLFHPSFLRQLIALGKFDGARTILSHFHDALINSSAVTDLRACLNLTDEQLFSETRTKSSQDKTNQSTRYGALFDTGAPDSGVDGAFSSSKAASLISLLKAISVAELQDDDVEELRLLANALVRIDPDESSLDLMGRRFYMSYIIMQERNANRSSTEVSQLTDEDVLWASKSEKQDILLTLVKSSVTSLTWQAAKAAKVFLWLKDRTALLQVAEIVAKAEFLKGEARDPVAASIWYQAMHKKATLLSLWRISGTHPEHNLTTKILANDFEQSKWITTANKNAYALVGRRRFEYAAAWFLLAGSLKDAIQVCIRNVADLDLAFAIARIWEDDHRGVVTTSILDKNYQDLARCSGSRVLACWASEFAGKFHESMQIATKTFGPNTRDTPALISVYEDLRRRTGPSANEREIVKYVIGLLELRGCHRISRYIARTWEYQAPTYGSSQQQTQEELTLEDYKAKKREVLVEAPQAIYQEPTMDSFAAFDF
ncbi:Putative uncharacterized protein [Taphrina deformans PYCC 5710]|uniref:RAVE complex protein Rav1 C-terminal domain-containing protein n=1 Tax=Taphrina deformans (strain PYCC 5710 / ATCC 11124 / CBS 356.35 / IMI 108563 / JCM 9778 / NBRC 8474) TaxID=1097556 RepID=R4XFY4_TAPDE|nr:Putative uncharacterized protein [Taphrina deformans PYCC 5710]|eukprot:CCG82289.1 Putative uncharacterized protein [Taphrina deformans PYCC 5710]